MKWHIQFSRYAMVGIVSNAIGYLVYLLLASFGMGHIAAMSLLYVVGVMQTFFFNRSWSFGHDGEVSSTFLRYLGVYALGYFTNLTILWLGVNVIALPHQAVQAVAIVVVAGMIFLLHRHWVFAPIVGRAAG